MTKKFSATKQIQKREQYTKWIYWSVGAGCVGFFTALVVYTTITEQQLVLLAGVGLYWLGALGMGVGYWYSPVSLRDEFEQQMEWEASQAVSASIIAVTIIGIPADVVLSTTGVYTAPAAVRGAVWAISCWCFSSELLTGL